MCLLSALGSSPNLTPSQGTCPRYQTFSILFSFVSMETHLSHRKALELVELWVSQLSLPSGFVGGFGLHQERQGLALQTVRRDVQGQDRRPSRGLSKADAQRSPAAHLRRDWLRSLRVPADGEALHGAHHHQDVQHSGRSGDPSTVRKVVSQFLLKDGFEISHPYEELS